MPAKMRGLYCTREEWGAVVVNYFQGSDLQLPLGKNGRSGVRQEMVREAAVKLCRRRGGNTYSPLGENYLYCGLFAGGALAQK